MIPEMPKSRIPPPPPPKLDISLGDAKVEDAPPHIPHVVHPDVVVCINHRERFTTNQRFAARNDLLEWVREKARKLGFTTVIGK